MYTSLNDAVITDAILAVGPTQVWFVKNEYYRAFCMGAEFAKADGVEFDPKNPKKTHVLVGYVTDAEKEELFDALQGENWSPNGEARDLVKSLSTHTSMSVGDVLIQHGDPYMVEDFGFAGI